MNQARIDTVLHPDWVLPIAVDGIPNAIAQQKYSIALAGQTIEAIAPRADIEARVTRQAATGQKPVTVVELPNRLLTPGLVNAHTHAAMTLLRGWGEDLALQPWLFERIWPTEQRLLSEEFVEFGTRLAIAEMLLTGTTCFADMYFFPEAVAREAIKSGIRAQVAFPIVEQHNPWCRDLNESFERGFALHDSCRSHDLVSVAFGPHSAYAASEAALTQVATFSEELFLRVQIHLHENPAEVQEAEAKGERWIAMLHRIGLMNPSLQAVHMTQLNQAEIDLTAQTGTSVVHCPASNMKLACGACPTRKLLDAGVTLALGTDGAASSNSLDMLQSARLMGLLAKHETADASNVSAFESLHAATLGGAQALGMGDRLGSIEAGKQADMVAFDTSHPAMLPLLDPVAQLVHTEAGGKVTDVWVAGQKVVTNGALQTIDQAALVAGSAHWQRQVQLEAQAP